MAVTDQRRILLLDTIDSLGNNDYLIIEDQHSDTGKTKIVRLSTIADYIRSGVSGEELEALIGLDPTKGSLEYRLSQLGSTDTTQLLILTSPNGGEEWAIGTPHNITWQQIGLSGYAKLEYNSNNRLGEWTPIASTVDIEDETYSWIVPTGAVGTQCLIRISSITHPSQRDTSNAPFAITSSVVGESITITSPQNNYKWRRGTNQNITWTSSGLGGTTVKIEHLNESKVTVTEIATGVTNNGAYQWAIPSDMALGIYSIRITSETSTLDPPPHDISPQFSIIANDLVAAINLITPNGGDTLKGGKKFVIRWVHAGFVGTEPVTINLIYNGTTSMITNAPLVGAGEYEWTIPAINYADCKIGLMCGTEGAIYAEDISTDVFTISTTGPEDTIAVTYPNETDSFDIGSVLPIEWTYTPTSPAQPLPIYGHVWLCNGVNDIGPIVIANNVLLSDEASSFAIPPSISAGSDYYIKITSDLTGNFDMSNNPISIGAEIPPAKYFTRVIHPYSGWPIPYGGAIYVRFTCAGFELGDRYQIFCSVTGGAPDTAWTRLTPAGGVVFPPDISGTIIWRWSGVGSNPRLFGDPPVLGENNIYSNMCVVRIEYLDDPDINILSPGVFSIVAPA